MSVAAWGTGRRPPRCTRWCYHNGQRAQCRKPAVAALQVGCFKNGNWDRPYPVCGECAALPWETARTGFTMKRVVTLEQYLKWLKGEEVHLDCYQRKQK